MTARRLISRLAAVVVLTASAGLAVTVAAAPAQAAACSGSGGVTVVVDPHQLGGAVAQQCSTDAGANAAGMFTGTGFTLTQVQRQPGFVCRINGAPAADKCIDTPPASAYWSLWWTDGTSSTWTYSSLGAYSLKVPAGGSVAFSWNQGNGGNIPPGVAPARRAEASAPSSPAASASSSSGSGSGSTGGSSSGTRSGSGGSNGSAGPATKSKAGSKPTARPAPATPSASASKPATAKASSTPTPSATESAAAAEAPAESADPDAGKTKRDGAKKNRAEQDGAATPAAEESAPTDEAPVPEAEPTSSAPAVIETGTTPTSAVTDPGGLPAWVVPGLLVALLGAAGATAAVRRRRATD